MGDRYKNFNELAAARKYGDDYTIDCLDRQSPVSVIAIHGGKLEPFTAAVAKAIAGDTYNCYAFRTFKGDWDLHITSNNFDEPKALALVQKSRLCVSVHGFKGTPKQEVIIGGLNARMREIALKNLCAAGLIDQETENPHNRLHGKRPSNIVNRAREYGLQLELSTSLRDILKADPVRLALFAAMIRQSIQEYLDENPTPVPKHLKGPKS